MPRAPWALSLQPPGHCTSAAYGPRQPRIVAPFSLPPSCSRGAPGPARLWGLGHCACPLSCRRTAGPSCGPHPSSSTKSLPSPRPHAVFNRTHTHTPPPPAAWPQEDARGAGRLLGEGLLSWGFQALRVAGRSVTLCLRVERVGFSLGKLGPQPGWQGVGAKGQAPELQALQRVVGGGSSVGLYGFPASRGTGLRKPLSPYNGPGWDL